MSLFAMLVAARTLGVDRTLALGGDQIRDWAVALRPFSELPLVGPSSVAGGWSLGPVFYWCLWLTRVTLGPFFDNLPHAGVYGLAVIHAAADVVLCVAVRRYTRSAVLALAMLLLLVTAPLDLILSRTLWNPTLAVSLVKIALALFLANALNPSRRRMALTVAVAWLAVQAHSSAILVSLPLIGWFVIREMAARRWRDTFDTVRLILEILLIMQIPYLVDRLLADAGGGAPTMITESVSALAGDVFAARPVATFGIVSREVASIWAVGTAGLAWALAAAVIATLARARQATHILFVTVLPLLTAVIGFAAWTHPFERYWFLCLAAALALLLCAGAASLTPGRTRTLVGWGALALVVWMQPGRIQRVADQQFTFYGPLVDGSKAIVQRTPVIGTIRTSFEIPPSTDPEFLYICLGGRTSPDAPFDALIAADGSVTFRSR